MVDRQDTQDDDDRPERPRHVVPHPRSSQHLSRPRHPVPRSASSNSRDVTSRGTTSFTPLSGRRFETGTGIAGSNSRAVIDPHTGRTNILADMAGVIHHAIPHARPPPQDYLAESSSDEGDHDMMDGMPHHSFGSQAGESRESSLPLLIRRGKLKE